MRKPTVGIIDYKEKPRVWLKRKVVTVTYPSDAPVSGANVTRAVKPLRAKQSPERKPWDWAGEEQYPGCSRPEKMVKELKYKLTRIQRMLGERKKGGVRSREPRLASEKRYGDLDFQWVPPPVYRQQQVIHCSGRVKQHNVVARRIGLSDTRWCYFCASYMYLHGSSGTVMFYNVVKLQYCLSLI